MKWDIWVSKLNTYICILIRDICILIRDIHIYDWIRGTHIHSTYGKPIPPSPIFTCAPFTGYKYKCEDCAVRPLTDDTEKLIKDAQDFTSPSLYRQTRHYKHSHIFGYKHAYRNFIRIGCHPCCPKRQLENSPFYALFLWLVEPRLR